MSDFSNLIPDYDPMAGRPGISDAAMETKFPRPVAPPARPFPRMFPGAAPKVELTWPEGSSRTEVAEACALVRQVRELSTAISTEREREKFLVLCRRAAQGEIAHIDSPLYTQLVWGAFSAEEKAARIDAAIEETRNRVGELEGKQAQLQQEIDARTRRIQAAITAAAHQLEERMDSRLDEVARDSLTLDEIARAVSSLNVDMPRGYSYFRLAGIAEHPSEPSEFQIERSQRSSKA